jgi:dTDP-4-dehydrorhamnose reductase
LGHVVCQRATAAGHEVVGTHHSPVGPRIEDLVELGVDVARLDVRDAQAVRHLVAHVGPEVVVHTAYRQDDWATTAGGAAAVALAAQDSAARLVLVSSDVVFPGGDRAFDEDDVPAPISEYGRAKAAAEAAVTGLVPDAVVVRTSLILGSSGGRPSPTERLVHDLARGRVEGALFTDDIRCPVHVDDLADALVELALDGATGVRHCAGPDALSRHEIGCLVAARDGLETARLRPGSRAGSAIEGPLELRLDSTRTQAGLSTRLRGAREFLVG